MALNVRPATAQDLPLICALIRELADYEKLTNAVRFDPDELGGHLFGPTPAAEAVIGEVDGAGQGFALFFPNFSTFEGKPGIYLEDLFVRPEMRGRGLGKALFVHVAMLARERGCARFEWSVLDWNAPSIAFYKALGAVTLDEWIGMRLDRAALEKLANRAQKG